MSNTQYILKEAIGAFITPIETFDDMDYLSEFLEDRVQNDMRENESIEDLNDEAEYNNLRELYFNNYSIEEITA